ncbi:unnamed protein product [Hermetia illucens]|uniref:MD-2-related lipid-recognition domain-containing protein n=1 Tax=Hermetia illucens TaxID=343691 RepID=A0A7R8UNY6_HERIL|nr:uncharacterized protein LOC119652984 isoform X1 [Hermetia illucens]CAD7084327.1 unnamed protein product [Hermetia illucens]
MLRIVVLKITFYFLCYVLTLCCAAPPDVAKEPSEINANLDARMVLFQDCGSIYDILELSITGCVQTPCKLQLGALVAVNAEFNDYGEDVHVLKHDAYWVLNAVNTKASVTPQACDGKSCPFRGDEGLAFTANLYINMTLPALRGTLFWEVYNESEERVMCYKVPISLMVP